MPPAAMQAATSSELRRKVEPFAGLPGDARLDRPVRELCDEQQPRSEDRRVPVDRALADDEECRVLRAGEDDDPRKQPRELPGEGKHQEEEGDKPDQPDQQPEPVRPQHQHKRARREDEHRGGAERQAWTGLA